MKKHLLWTTLLLVLSVSALNAQNISETMLQLWKQYDKVETIGDDRHQFIQVSKKQDKYTTYKGVFDASGKEIVPVSQYKIEWNKETLCFEAWNNETRTAAVYNQYGTIVVPPINQSGQTVKFRRDLKIPGTENGAYEAGMLVKDSEGNDKVTYGYYLCTGEVLVPVGKYKYVYIHEHNLHGYVVEGLEGKYGYIAKGGKEIIPPIYSDVKTINDLGFITSRSDKDKIYKKYYQLLGKDGQVIVPEGKYDALYKANKNLTKHGLVECCMLGIDTIKTNWYTTRVVKNGLLDAKTGNPVFNMVDGYSILSIDWQDYPNGNIVVVDIKENSDTVRSTYNPKGILISSTVSPRIIKQPETKPVTNENIAKSNETKPATSSNIAKGNNATMQPSSSSRADTDTDIPKSTKAREETYAFIIANEHYTQKNVPFAINDGYVFKEYCEKTLGVPANQIRFYQDATTSNIITCVEQMKQAAKANSGDLKIIFYYAGHAFPDEQTHSAYLLPVDGDVNVLRTCYSLNSLYKDLSNIQVRSVVCFIDACFSGATRENEVLLAGRGVAIKVKDDIPRGNVVVFTSASGAETAHQYKEKQHGMFTYFLLKKLQESNGNTTLGELSDYVTRQVKKTSFNVNNKVQTPTVIPSVKLQANWRNIKL